MQLCDLNLPSPPGTLALDEVLLDRCEEGTGDEVLRFWEPRTTFVVLGHSCRVRDDVHEEVCDARGIPILRRHSGGGTVVQMPGCLNYALVLRIDHRRELETITDTNAFVMGKLCRALQRIAGDAVSVDGHTDLVLGERKFCGNAQRRRIRSVLFHGVILLKADIPLIEQILTMPPRQPLYRNNRTHTEFLTNAGWPIERVKGELRTEWDASGDPEPLALERVVQLVRTKYGTPSWTYQR